MSLSTISHVDMSSQSDYMASKDNNVLSNADNSESNEKPKVSSVLQYMALVYLR